MDSRRNSNSSTAFVVIVIVIIVILVITAGLKNSARPWRIKRANMTSSSHQRGRSSPILVSSIKIASTRNNKTAAVLQSLNKVKPKWNPNNPRPHGMQRRPISTQNTKNKTLKAIIDPIEPSYLNESRALPLPRNTG
ncbi:hypothetical protein DAPPUDRAFT_302747 [Daphnia pulex]|uniref:Uncharacterized protein n=1 Tax=Daphnia pulex TaxID=6669 RepID=E9HPP4_DAPPU|nr:hypothetical protein DAPPUDRAFT_302747 [Daphnia pulex]|eukprot:EFX66303.1 hypothetical protein DAPPUDRAFT_302747 [Daphnia pulex]